MRKLLIVAGLLTLAIGACSDSRSSRTLIWDDSATTWDDGNWE